MCEFEDFYNYDCLMYSPVHVLKFVEDVKLLMDKWHKTDSSAFYIVLKSNMQWSLGLLPIINIVIIFFINNFIAI